ALADPRLARRADLAPERVALGERRELGHVPPLRVARPGLAERERAADTRIARRRGAAAQLVVATQAEVVAEPLAERRLDREAEVLGDEREILREDLLFERLGGGGDHHLAPAQDGRHE